MGRAKRVAYECDGCGVVKVGVSDYELPRGYHGGDVQVSADWGGRGIPAWWACSDECMHKIVEDWISGKGVNE